MNQQSDKHGLRYQPWSLSALPGESSEHLRERRYEVYFQWQLAESIPDWWKRFQVPAPDFTGARVLDLGCGHGSMVLDLLRKGATRVVGVDLDENRIAFASRYVPQAYPLLAGRASFQAADIGDVQGSFDAIVSKDTFEHILELKPVMRHIRRLLRPGGHLYAGSSPLYYSPFGDHEMYWGARFLPWLPVYTPEPILLKMADWRKARERRGLEAGDPADIGLNKMTPAQFRELFDPSAWLVESIAYNSGDKLLLKPMSMLRKIGFLEKYFTTGMYVIAHKRTQVARVRR